MLVGFSLWTVERVHVEWIKTLFHQQATAPVRMRGRGRGRGREGTQNCW